MGRIITLAVAAALIATLAGAADLIGVVTDSEGRPVEGAAVWVHQDHDVRTAHTGADGAFAFLDVPGRPADVVAFREGRALGGVTVPVPGAAPAIVQLGEGDSLKLVVKDLDSEPVAGAFVKYLYVNDAFSVAVEELAGVGFPPLISDADGRLTVPALPKGGHVRFTLAHRQYADSLVAYLPVGGKEQVILLYPGVALRGRITNESGAGVGRARVAIFRFGRGGQRQTTEAMTDPEGFYSAIVRPGEYFVAVRHPDYASPEPKAVSLYEDRDTNVVDQTLPPACVIEGVVRFADGAPCVGAPVSYWIGESLYEEVLSQHDGAFHLQAPNKEGHIRIIPPNGFMLRRLDDIVMKAPLVSMTRLSPVELIPLPVIEGTAVNADGAPEPNVLVSSADLEFPVWTISDTEGKFRVQLFRMPQQRTASFRAEHAERFLRGGFEVTLPEPGAVRVMLAAFEPDATPREVAPGGNDMTSLAGAPAPEIECDTWFNGDAVTLASFKGKVVVLVFWGGFDERPAARDSLEELRALYDLLRPAGDVAFVGIHDAGNEPEEIKEFIKGYRVPFPVGRDAEPFRTFTKYDIRYIPQVVLIDRKGVLRYFQVEGRLLELIKALRREAP